MYYSMVSVIFHITSVIYSLDFFYYSYKPRLNANILTGIYLLYKSAELLKTEFQELFPMAIIVLLMLYIAHTVDSIVNIIRAGNY